MQGNRVAGFPSFFPAWSADMRDILQTERLVLRTLRVSDAQSYSKYASDWDVARMTGSLPYPIPVISAEIKIEMLLSRRRRGKAFPYAITLNGEDMIGVMDIFRRDDGSDFELGYWVARDYWGKGYAPEAAIAVMKEGQSSIGVNRFVAGVFSDNPASVRVLSKLGFESTGSDGDYFSMARLKHAESIGFALDLTAQIPNHLQNQEASLIDAH